MSAECPHRCPNVRFRSNVRQKRQFVTKMSEKMSECPHVRMPAISIPLNVYKGIATNVREMSACPQNVREMSACPKPMSGHWSPVHNSAHSQPCRLIQGSHHEKDKKGFRNIRLTWFWSHDKLSLLRCAERT